MQLRFPLFLMLLTVFAMAKAQAQPLRGCVFKVTGPGGHTLYLGGSVHGLRSVDYPLPPSYSRAFDLSERLVFEEPPATNTGDHKRLSREARYSKDDTLKNHVDPRTYEYLKKIFARLGAKDDSWAKLRPWAIIAVLWTPELSGFSTDLGIEGFLKKRAIANHKLIDGLETVQEHIGILSGLTDRQAEAVILLTFIPHTTSSGDSNLVAWRRGDVEALAASSKKDYADFPAFGARIIDERNRNWIPKIESYLRSGHTYFVVAGAAHFGGPNGVLALLRARGYQIEQL